MTRHVLSRVLAAGLLSLLLAAMVPAATAQVGPHIAAHAISAQAHADGPPIQPLTETREFPIDVEVRCRGPVPDIDIRPHRLTYSIWSDRAWSIATIDKSDFYYEVAPLDCTPGAVWHDTVRATVAFTKDAPAFDHATFDFVVESDLGEQATAEWVATAGFYERWQARFDLNIVRVGANDQFQIPFAVENHGNGAIIIVPAVGEGTTGGVHVVPPDQFLVPSLIQGGETDKVTLPVDGRSGSESRRDHVVLSLAGRSADDPSLAIIPIEVTAVVETDGSMGDPVPELPAVGPMMTLLGILGAAFVRRRL